MESLAEPPQTSRKRITPRETWPISIEILKALIAAGEHITVREIALRASVPVGTLREYLAHLEAVAAVSCSPTTVPSGHGAPRLAHAYGVTEYGRQCAVGMRPEPQYGRSHVSNLTAALGLWRSH